MSAAFPFQLTESTNNRSHLRPVPTETSGKPQAVITVITRIEVDQDSVEPIHARMAQQIRELGLNAAEAYVHPPHISQETRTQPQPVTIGDSRVRIVIPARLVTIDGTPVDLTRLEFDLLRFLSEHPGEVHTRDDLLRAVWQVNAEIYTRTVDVHVRRLRQKLAAAPGLISTVRGVGYRFDNDGGVDIDYGW